VVVRSHPEVTAIRVTEELKIWQAIRAKRCVRAGDFNGGKCEVAVTNETPGARRRSSAEGGNHLPELRWNRLWAARVPRRVDGNDAEKEGSC